MALTPDKLYAHMDAGLTETVSGGIYRVAFLAMGTACHVIYSAHRPAAANDFRVHMLRWLADFEAKYSRYLDDSLICELNRYAGISWVEIDEELERMFQLCDWYHWLTDGIFDPSTLPLIKLWDYQAKNPVVPDETSIWRAMSLVNWRKVMREGGKALLPQEGMAIDIGGIGKEYAVDQVMAMAQDRGIRDILINFGQDIRW